VVPARRARHGCIDRRDDFPVSRPRDREPHAGCAAGIPDRPRGTIEGHAPMTTLTKLRLTCVVNREPVDLLVDGYKTLLELLREDLQLTGTKHGCELGECGACAVLVDGQPVLSCLLLGAECEGRSVTTVEGLAADGRLHPLQESFADLGAAQCGYCTPGILVTAKALLDQEPHPTRERICEALSGNLCRCTGYLQIIEAVEAASRMAPADEEAKSR
jgi:carbon-monoxide dehydrogenase small subunit